jgi:serine/threonine protein kinase
MSPLTSGLRLGNRYTLRDLIGVGGMSQVWRADDEVLGRPVAVKVLTAALAADPTLSTATRAEARAAAQLAHPHVAQVYDYGEAPLPDGEVRIPLQPMAFPGFPLREFVVRSIGADGTLPLLYIDDSVNDRLLVREAILLTKTPFAFYQADGLEAAMPYFQFHGHDREPKQPPRPALVLLDYDLGNHTGETGLFTSNTLERRPKSDYQVKPAKKAL